MSHLPAQTGEDDGTFLNDLMLLRSPPDYPLPQVGRMDSDKAAHIRLSGENILEEHCHFENNDGKVTLHALGDGATVSYHSGSLFGLAAHPISPILVPERQTDCAGSGNSLS